jgi:hypothetical protein
MLHRNGARTGVMACSREQARGCAVQRPERLRRSARDAKRSRASSNSGAHHNWLRFLSSGSMNATKSSIAAGTRRWWGGMNAAPWGPRSLPPIHSCSVRPVRRCPDPSARAVRCAWRGWRGRRSAWPGRWRQSWPARWRRSSRHSGRHGHAANGPRRWRRRRCGRPVRWYRPPTGTPRSSRPTTAGCPIVDLTRVASVRIPSARSDTRQAGSSRYARR